jgi:hypothetical protein
MFFDHCLNKYQYLDNYLQYLKADTLGVLNHNLYYDIKRSKPSKGKSS